MFDVYIDIAISQELVWAKPGKNHCDEKNDNKSLK